MATLNRGPNVSAFYFGGTVSPYVWVTTHDYTRLDYSSAIDIAPGAGNAWAFSAEWAPLAPEQNCADVTSWTAAPLCTISGTNKSCRASNVPVAIVGPACVRGRGVPIGSPPPRGGGTASFDLSDATGNGPVHFQGTGGQPTNVPSFSVGNWSFTAKHDRSFWLTPGVALQSAGGIVALVDPPGAGNTWHMRVASSTTALRPAQNCLDLAYTVTGDVCTISGATQKSCSWTPVPMRAPAGGCVQIRGAWSGTTFASVRPTNWGLDVVTTGVGGASYSDAASGAFDAGHTFGTGPWAIGDLNATTSPSGQDAVANQQYWLAPLAGLSACGGAFTFTSATTGNGQFDIGLRTSTTAPMDAQSCLDLRYTDTAALCTMKPGEKSCSFPLTPVAITSQACFALMVKQSRGAPVNLSPFNWQASCATGTIADPIPAPAPTTLELEMAQPTAAPDIVKLDATTPYRFWLAMHPTNPAVVSVAFHRGDLSLVGVDRAAPYSLEVQVVAPGPRTIYAIGKNAAGVGIEFRVTAVTVRIE